MTWPSSSRAIALWWLLLATGCSEPIDPNRNVVHGTVLGEPIVTKSAIAGQGLLAAAPVREVLLSSVATICDNIRELDHPLDAQHIQLRLFTFTNADGIVPADKPGEYRVVSDEPDEPGNYAAIYYSAWENDHFTANFLGGAGTVTLTAISERRIVGSFNTTLSNRDALQATFDAKQCDSLVCPVQPNTTFPCF